MLNSKPNNKRWYDMDPTISLAISILQNTSKDNQYHIAGMLIENGQKLNIQIKKRFKLFSKRWYDQDKRLSEAIEYFQNFPPEEQKRIAIQIIERIYNLDGSCDSV